ncbi:10196_t:CDS:2, partial [Funneliformis geosporum]
EKTKLRSYFFKNSDKVDKAMEILDTCQTPKAKLDFMRETFLKSGINEKRKFSEEFRAFSIPNKKKFSINSTIMPWERKNVYFVDPAENNEKLIELICEGEYVLLHGPRASGKSTRALRAMDQLEEIGYLCIYYLSADVDRFWKTVARGIRRELVKKYKDRIKLAESTSYESYNIPDMETIEDIMDVFAVNAEIWNHLYDGRSKNIILFFDELDTLLTSRLKEVCNSFLSNLRVIKTGPSYVIKSVIGIGTFSILSLNQSDRSLSPFNINDAFANPNFTKGQVKIIFKDFMNDRDLNIDDRIIDDIYASTNGHAGLVNLCGREVEEINGEYSSWILYKIKNLGMEISNYATFARLIKSLKSDDAQEAMTLLRTRFLGSLDTEEITDYDELALVKFLISEGVLIYEGDFRNSNNNFTQVNMVTCSWDTIGKKRDIRFKVIEIH